MADITMNFFTGIHDQQTDKTHLSLDYVGKKYLKSFFAIDLLTSVPNNLLFLYVVSVLDFWVKWIKMTGMTPVDKFERKMTLVRNFWNISKTRVDS